MHVYLCVQSKETPGYCKYFSYDVPFIVGVENWGLKIPFTVKA